MVVVFGGLVDVEMVRAKARRRVVFDIRERRRERELNSVIGGLVTIQYLWTTTRSNSDPREIFRCG